MRRPLFAAGLALAVIMAVWLWAEGLWKPSDSSEAASPASGETVTITGQVCRKDTGSFTLKSVVLYQISQEAAVSQQGISYREKWICETETAEEVPLGSTVTVKGKFAPFSQASNPGEFDSRAYYRSTGIFGKLADAEILCEKMPKIPLWEGLYRIRVFWKEKLFRILPEKEAAIMTALLLGDRENLDVETKALYKRNGILHILSISSLHITIMGMGLYRLLRRLRTPVWAAALAGGVLMVLYGVMTGLGVSVCRAVGMYLLRMLAETVGRTYDMRNALGMVGGCMLLYQPRYLLNSGFLLSFSAVLGIGVLYPALSELRGEKAPAVRYGESRWRKAARKFGKGLRENVLLSLSVTLATLPVQLWFYYEAPVFGVAINLLVLPFVKPLLIAGAAALILPFSGAVCRLDCLILGWYESLCRFIDALPVQLWNPGRPQAWQVAVYYALLGAALWGSGRRMGKLQRRGRGGERPGGNLQRSGRAGKRLGQSKRIAEAAARFLPGGRRYALCAGGILAAVWILAVRPPAGNQVTFLSVGQGDCAIVQTAAGQTYLLDCGSSSRSGVGQYVLLPYLKYKGIRTIDAVFLTHPDTDHVNGALELFSFAGENGIRIGQLILPDIEKTAKEEQLGELILAAEAACEDGGTAVRYLAAGDRWECGDARFLCLHPQAGCSAGNANAYSLCIYAEFGEAGEPQMTALFTGDVEAEGEEALCRELAAHDIRAVTLLKVAHHGSKNATSAAFLEQLQPEAAVISCGKNNRYGHPHQELLERLETCGARLWITWESGAVSFRPDREKVWVETYLGR